jgi:hypothetical protein|tara:strand:+ start:27 stop:668 length:642 start_codon:yes stop_codon:yes gene_type:complete
MPDELDLTKLTVTEYLAAAAARLKDLYRPETGDRGFALSPEAAGSPLPTFAVGAGPGPGRLGFSAETNFPVDLLAARDYTRSPDSGVTTRRDTLEAGYGPVSAFYSTGDGATTYGGETSLGPLFGGSLRAGGSRTAGAQDPVNSYFTKWTGKAGPGTLGLTVGQQGRDKNVAASYSVENPFGLGGNLRAGADYADPEGGKPFVGGRVGYGVTF